MAELANFSLRPCVVWETPLPDSGKICKSPDFFLQGPRYVLHLLLEPDCSCYLLVTENTLWKHETFTVTTFIHESKWRVSHVLQHNAGTIDTRFNEHYICLCSGGSYDIAKFKGEFTEGRPELKIVCLFDIAPESKITCNNERIYLSSKTDSPLSSHQGSRNSSKCKLSSDKGVQASLSVPGKLESLSLDFSNLLEHEILTDVKLRCGGRTIAAHRAVLSARSEVFAAMFRNKMAENEAAIVDVADLDASQFNLFMKYVYSGDIPDLFEDVARSLYAAADKYAVHSLKALCSEWMVGNLTEENCLGFLILADRHSDEGLKESVVDFIVKELGALRKEAWSKFRAEHPSLAVIVYEKHCEASLSKQV